jgi:uncharacterized protein (TIGR02145 family)
MKNKVLIGIFLCIIVNKSIYAQVKDVEGNEYPTLNIFGNIWMTENLKTSKFNNGDDILEVKNLMDWTNAIINRTPAFYIDPDNPQLGKIYNGFAVSDKRGISPKDFSIPSSIFFDWNTLNSSYISLPNNISKNTFLGSYVNSSGYNEDCAQSNSFYISPGIYTDIHRKLVKEKSTIEKINSHGIWWLMDDSELSFCGSRCTGDDGEYFMGYDDFAGGTDSKRWLGYGFYVRCVKTNTTLPICSNLSDAFSNKNQELSLVINFQKFIFSDSIFEITNLQRLHLSYCEIEELPNNFNRFKCLKYLDLSNNAIKLLPQSFETLKTLEYLNLEGNFELKIDFNILRYLTNCKYMKIPFDYKDKFYFEEQLKELKRILPNCKIEY